MANVYTVGARVRMTATFKDASGNGIDPDAVTCSMLLPGNVTSSPTVVRDGVGLYHADVLTATPGVHRYRFTGAGTADAAGESAFTAQLTF